MTLRPNLICLLLLFLTTAIVAAEPTRDPATATTVNTVAPELPTATPASVGMSAVKLAKITDSMQNLVDNHRVAGAVAIVIRKGKVVYFQAAGQRDIAGNLPMEKDTIMRFYSMTKPITTVAAMILVEEGKLQLEDSITKYIPEFKNLRVYAAIPGEPEKTVALNRPVTIRDLMRHTSGLTYGFLGNTWVDQQYRLADVVPLTDTMQQSINKLSKIPLLYQPGQQFNYSVSTDVLGYIVNRVSGVSLSNFMQQRIFRPLDMVDTAFHVSAKSTHRFASMYSPQLIGGLALSESATASPFLRPPGQFSGGGGLLSTARDYSRFCQMLINLGELNGTRILTADSVREMTKNQLPEKAFPIRLILPQPGVGFGLGVSVVVENKNPAKHSRVGEYGWTGIASTHFWISPQDELAVVLLSQLMPYTPQLEAIIKPLVYDAIK